MNNITAEKLKAETFNLNSVVEALIGGIITDDNNVEKELKNILITSESLREAIIYKMEKSKHYLEHINDSEFEALYEKFYSLTTNIFKNDSDDSSILLRNSQRITELKTIQKYLRYSSELEKHPEEILSSLFNSEILEDSLFLSRLISYNIKYIPEDLSTEESISFLGFSLGTKTVSKNETILKLLYTYSKKLEEKMDKIFSDSFYKRNISGGIIAFNTLSPLEKEFLLIDQYLIYSGILKIDTALSPLTNSVFDFDQQSITKSDFSILIDNILNIFQNNMEFQLQVFKDNPFHINYIVKETFKSVVFRALENILDPTYPVFYLSALHHAYIQCLRITTFFSEIYPGIVLDDYVKEAIQHHILLAVEIEKNLFQEIYGILSEGSNSKTTYIMTKKNLKKTTDQFEIYKYLLYFIDHAETRIPVLYHSKDETSLLLFYYSKMGSIIKNIQSQTFSRDEIDLILVLTKIYLLTKRYFGKKISILKDFLLEINRVVKTLFRKKIDKVQVGIKDKIGHISLSHPEGYNVPLDYLKNSISSCNTIAGRNNDIYLDKILDIFYKHFKRQLLRFTEVVPEHEKTIQSMFNNIIGYVAILNRHEMVMKYIRLRDLSYLMTSDRSMVFVIYEEFSGTLTSEELDKVVSCRKDHIQIRQAIKELNSNNVHY